MRDRVTIAYRGAAYELGRGKDYYGLWAVGAAPSEPVERWPQTPDGWAAAWTRFTTVETPGTIAAAGRGRSARLSAGGAASPAADSGMTAVLPQAPETEAFDAVEADPPGTGTAVPGPVGTTPAQPGPVGTTPAQPEAADSDPPDSDLAGADVIETHPAERARRRIRVPAPAASGLVTAGVILGVIGLFPSYYTGSSVASQSPLLVTHVASLAGWTIAALLIMLGGARQRSGALLATGLSVVTIGLLLTDLFQATTAHVGLGPGTWLGLAGWLLCALGGGFALLLGSPGRIGRPRGLGVTRVAVLSLVGVGAAITFAPPWDSYLLKFASGQSQTTTAGNAFSNPGLVITTNVLVMVLFALLVIAAALWRPIHLGSMLLAGAVLPMAAQAVSALVQVSQPTPPSQFGVSQSTANALGMTITNGVTPWFWIFSMLIVVLIASFAWMLITPSAAVAAAPAIQPVHEPAANEADDKDW